MSHLLTGEQSKALESLSQRERIEIVLNVLIKRLEKDLRRRAFEAAIIAVDNCGTKADAIAALTKELNHGSIT